MLLLSKTNQDVYCFVSSSECFYTDKILIQGHVPELWPPWHSSFTHCVLTEVCTSRMKKIKLFLHSRKFLHSWLRRMVPQKHKGPGKGDSDLFLFTVSPECVWWAHPRCVSTETLGLVEGPAATLPLAVWSEAAKFTRLCQSGELQGCCQNSQAQIWDLLGRQLLTTSSYKKPLTQKSSCLWSEEV